MIRRAPPASRCHSWDVAGFVLLAVGLALVVTPAYHRQAAPYALPADLARIASVFATLGLAPLMLAVSIDLYIITSVVWKSVALAAALSGSLLALFVALWFVSPQCMARRRERARRPHDARAGPETASR